MDAMTLYMVVRLANGEAHTALKVSLREGQTCERAKLDAHAYLLMDDQYKAGAKLITIFCTGPAGTEPAMRR